MSAPAAFTAAMLFFIVSTNTSHLPATFIGMPQQLSFVAHVGEVDARLVEQTHARLGDVRARRSSRCSRRSRCSCSRAPGRVFPRDRAETSRRDAALARPDVVLAPQRRRHHLERREGHLVARGSSLPRIFIHDCLDRQPELAADVADLARRADEERVDHLLVDLLPALGQTRAGRATCRAATGSPAAVRVLVALVDAVAALRARVGVGERRRPGCRGARRRASRRARCGTSSPSPARSARAPAPRGPPSTGGRRPAPCPGS